MKPLRRLMAGGFSADAAQVIDSRTGLIRYRTGPPVDERVRATWSRALARQSSSCFENSSGPPVLATFVVHASCGAPVVVVQTAKRGNNVDAPFAAERPRNRLLLGVPTDSKTRRKRAPSFASRSQGDRCRWCNLEDGLRADIQEGSTRQVLESRRRPMRHLPFLLDLARRMLKTEVGRDRARAEACGAGAAS